MSASLPEILLLKWRAVLPLDIEWEEACLDAVEAGRGRGYRVQVEHTNGPIAPTVIVLAYPASAHGDQRIVDAIDACVRQRVAAHTRLGVVACGRSDLSVSQNDVAQVAATAPGFAGLHAVRAVHASELRDNVERWIIASAQWAWPSPIGGDYTTEGTIERNTDQEGGLRWTGLD